MDSGATAHLEAAQKAVRFQSRLRGALWAPRSGRGLSCRRRVTEIDWIRAAPGGHGAGQRLWGDSHVDSSPASQGGSSRWRCRGSSRALAVDAAGGGPPWASSIRPRSPSTRRASSSRPAMPLTSEISEDGHASLLRASPSRSSANRSALRSAGHDRLELRLGRPSGDPQPLPPSPLRLR